MMLIPEVRQWWRYYSARLAVAAGVGATLIVDNWAVIGSFIDLAPGPWRLAVAAIAGVSVAGAALYARFVAQPELRHQDNGGDYDGQR